MRRSTAKFLLAGLSWLGVLAWSGESSASTPTSSADDIKSADIDVQDYYIVTRIDTRKCIYPLCGGVFVKQVNQRLTQCADGHWQEDCHVAEIDYERLDLDDATQEKLSVAVEGGKALVRGKLFQAKDEGGSGYPVDTLALREAWVGATGNTPSGKFARVDDSGIVCVTYPCPIYDARYLNTSATQPLSAVDLEATGASPEVVDAAFNELYDTGLLVVGRLFRDIGPAGTMAGLRATEFYRRVTSSNRCDLESDRCPFGQYCASEPGVCGEGVCTEQPDACLDVWIPVCGCDDQTYSNAGCAAVAGVSVAYEGACACAPMDAVGVGPCDLFLGYAWNGGACVGLSGCECKGDDCKKLYDSQKACEYAHALCGDSESSEW